MNDNPNFHLNLSTNEFQEFKPRATDHQAPCSQWLQFPSLFHSFGLSTQRQFRGTASIHNRTFEYERSWTTQCTHILSFPFVCVVTIQTLCLSQPYMLLGKCQMHHLTRCSYKLDNERNISLRTKNMGVPVKCHKNRFAKFSLLSKIPVQDSFQLHN